MSYGQRIQKKIVTCLTMSAIIVSFFPGKMVSPQTFCTVFSPFFGSSQLFLIYLCQWFVHFIKVVPIFKATIKIALNSQHTDICCILYTYNPIHHPKHNWKFQIFGDFKQILPDLLDISSQLDGEQLFFKLCTQLILIQS